MRTPPFLIGVALLFWGWQSGQWFFAVPMAAALEGSRFLRARWEFSQTDYHRIWNLCTALFFGATIYIITAKEGGGAVAGLFQASAGARSEALSKTSRSALLLFQWFPIIFFPFIAAQAYSVKDTVALSTFSWWLRRKSATNPEPILGAGVNVSSYYFALCLVAASATNQRSLGFYAGFSLLLAWSFWQRRSRRFSTVLWCGMIAVVVALGYVGHVGLNRLQNVLESMDVPWLSRFSGIEFDPKESRTAIGSIGRLKLSGRIVLRVETDGPSPPALLRQASYNLFKSPGWFAARKDFIAVTPEADETTWILQPQSPGRQSVTVSHYLRQGRGLLALPLGVTKLESLPALLLEHNRMGVVRVTDGPGLVSYRARYDESGSIDSAPVEDDLRLPEAEATTLSQIAGELALASMTPAEAIRAVTGFFQDRFQYSTYLRAPTGTSNRTALGEFLLNSRAGHCEYFATATTLLLRAAKVPTRYVAGYSVQERSGRQYVVRERHAHAWCLVHLNGAWRELDTTPTTWVETEAARASSWERLSDAWSGLWFKFSKWRWGQTNLRTYLLWIAVPLVIGLAAQFILKMQGARSRSGEPNRALTVTYPGLDSEFFAIERRLLESGLDRQPGETLAGWIDRVVPEDTLSALVQLHYRLRFDPEGLSGSERAELQRGVRLWLEKGDRGRAVLPQRQRPR